MQESKCRTCTGYWCCTLRLRITNTM